MTSPQPLRDRALDNLQFIRSTMERAGSFTAVPGWGMVVLGVTALAASTYAGSLPVAPVYGAPQSRWLWVWMFERHRLRFQFPDFRGLAFGAGFGLAVAIFVLVLYYGALRASHYLRLARTFTKVAPRKRCTGAWLISNAALRLVLSMGMNTRTKSPTWKKRGFALNEISMTTPI